VEMLANTQLRYSAALQASKLNARRPAQVVLSRI